MFDFKNWCGEFFNARVEAMDSDVAECFATMASAECNNFNNEDVRKQIEDTFMFRVVDVTCAKYNLAANFYTKAFLFSLCRSPAQAVMYIAALKSKLPDGSAILSLEKLSEIFPRGFITEPELSRLWDLQKMTSEERGSRIIDNHLDFLSEQDYAQ